ncbi:NADP-dependent oxidoreductase [Mangrovihabitans endophyticus]|uniref:NADPH:quinone reductase n=1 Tax=Mangrovihabitans endophyticus TaxID=1751298 RepID=A0A8J3FRZ7_9ACTN|nr:NADP-dependent oxidoreductase [Mangrovihabitans endophyticus]GGL13484.1 NADPH:quinone reductase [Mangrovihabitans endophyticus]
MTRAVRFDQYGDVDVLHVVDVPRPDDPSSGQVVVEVVAAGINPGEIAIRSGAMHERFPATFPSGQGSDFAGRVAAVGDGVTGVRPGDEVVGWSDKRSAQAEFVTADAGHVTPKPLTLDWIRAGGLFVAGVTAYAAVRAVALKPGETVAVSGAAGGVGSLAVQLARETGADVIGIAGEANERWLRAVGVTPVSYGDGLEDRLRAAAPDGVNAFIDTFGGGYVERALKLGVAADRIDTIIDFAAVQKFGVKGEGSAAASSAEVLAHMADLVAWGRVVMPVSAVYPLGRVREAYTELALRHTHGKIVLATGLPDAAGRQAAHG